MWATERATLTALPPDQRERLARIARLNADRVDDTHPATWRRIEALKRLPSIPCHYAYDQTTVTAITQELANEVARVGRTIRNIHRNQ